MNRVQFYPGKKLDDILSKEAKSKGVSRSKFVTDLLEDYKAVPSITELTTIVFEEIEEYIKNGGGIIEFDLNTASSTYRNIDMTCGKKPSAVRASIGRSFAAKIGKEPFENVRKCVVDGKQKLSLNNALVYETY